MHQHKGEQPSRRVLPDLPLPAHATLPSRTSMCACGRLQEQNYKQALSAAENYVGTLFLVANRTMR